VHRDWLKLSHKRLNQLAANYKNLDEWLKKAQDDLAELEKESQIMSRNTTSTDCSTFERTL
jgi:hypothetical protein